MIATNGGRITTHPLLEHIQVESSCVCRSCAVTPMRVARSVGPAHDTVSNFTKNSPTHSTHLRATHTLLQSRLHPHHFLSQSAIHDCACVIDQQNSNHAIMWLNHDRTRASTATCRIVTISIFSYYPHDRCSECLYCVDEEGDLLHTLAGELHVHSRSEHILSTI